MASTPGFQLSSSLMALERPSKHVDPIVDQILRHRSAAESLLEFMKEFSRINEEFSKNVHKLLAKHFVPELDSGLGVAADVWGAVRSQIDCVASFSSSFPALISPIQEGLKATLKEDSWKDLKNGRIKAFKSAKALEETHDKHKIKPPKDAKAAKLAHDKIEKRMAQWNTDCHEVFQSAQLLDISALRSINNGILVFSNAHQAHIDKINTLNKDLKARADAITDEKSLESLCILASLQAPPKWEPSKITTKPTIRRNLTLSVRAFSASNMPVSQSKSGDRVNEVSMGNDALKDADGYTIRPVDAEAHTMARNDSGDSNASAKAESPTGKLKIEILKLDGASQDSKESPSPLISLDATPQHTAVVPPLDGTTQMANFMFALNGLSPSLASVGERSQHHRRTRTNATDASSRQSFHGVASNAQPFRPTVDTVQEKDQGLFATSILSNQDEGVAQTSPYPISDAVFPSLDVANPSTNASNSPQSIGTKAPDIGTLVSQLQPTNSVIKASAASDSFDFVAKALNLNAAKPPSRLATITMQEKAAFFVQESTVMKLQISGAASISTSFDAWSLSLAIQNPRKCTLLDGQCQSVTGTTIGPLQINSEDQWILKYSKIVNHSQSHEDVLPNSNANLAATQLPLRINAEKSWDSTCQKCSLAFRLRTDTGHSIQSLSSFSILTNVAICELLGNTANNASIGSDQKTLTWSASSLSQFCGEGPFTVEWKSEERPTHLDFKVQCHMDGLISQLGLECATSFNEAPVQLNKNATSQLMLINRINWNA